LKAVREKKQITYKGKCIKITADFSTETLKARRAWNEVFLALSENNFSLENTHRVGENICQLHIRQRTDNQNI
jgi:hypothetical protein